MSQKAVMWITRASVDRYDPAWISMVAVVYLDSCLSSHEQNEGPSTSLYAPCAGSSVVNTNLAQRRAEQPRQSLQLPGGKFFLLGVTGF